MTRPSFLRRASMALAIPLAASLAFAQGSDTCAGAQPISGNGSHNFLNFAATTDGAANALCNFFGQSQIERDVWFAWTATTTGSAQVTSCGGTSVDTRIAAYNGLSCPATAIVACSDDNCSLQTTIQFPCTAGGTYLLRVGVYPGAAGGAGQITISQTSSNNDNCANAQPISGTGTFPFNNATATTDGTGSTPCDFFGSNQIERDVWFAWTATSTGAHTLQTCGQTTIDSKMAVYSSTACPAGTPIACNDDSCNLQSSLSVNANAGVTYLVRVGVYTGSAGGAGALEIVAGGGGGGECATPSSGPDVIVGELIGISKWGTVGTITGYSVGTTSCNVGTQGLSWVSTTNQHPVIGQNMFRLKNGRFEQIGMGWLKHGFLALNQDVCCTCQNPGTGQILGVGCSDPYSADLNGLQEGSGGTGGLGPRSDVNPHTGAFPFPYSFQGQSGNAIYKRIQVQNADVDPASNPGAQYFAEGHYVAPDDATAGNGNNNVSYRPMVVGALSGGGYALNLTGTTERRKAAIYAWQAADPLVNLQPAQVPGDGLFVVGSRATDNGNGTHHYEYAVYNMNSDRAAQSFAVPVGAGVVVTNVGFHDIDSHSGEPYATTDWTASNAGGFVTWSTQTFAQNVNANALRWGRLYNFRFDANVAPQSGNVSLTLFEPGSPGALSIAAAIPSSAGSPLVPFCFGNGSGTPCPCGNAGALGNGCASSVNANGANLAASGSPSISGDTLVLLGSGMPNSSALYFQGTTQQNGGLGSVFGDGLRCAGGSVIRLGTKINASGASSYPQGGDLSISVKGANAAGNVRSYQIWYRNAASFCTADTFNLSNGVTATWQP